MLPRREASPLAADYSTTSGLLVALSVVRCTPSDPHDPPVSFVALFISKVFELGDVSTVFCRQSAIVRFRAFFAFFGEIQVISPFFPVVLLELLCYK